MSGKSSPGFAGLIVEGAVIGLVVALLPKLPLGTSAAATPVEVADQRPTLTPTRPPTHSPAPTHREELPSPPANWRTAVSRPAAPLSPPPADPAFVEERLDQASQQLVSGLATYLTRHAEEVLATPPPQSQPPTPPDRQSLSAPLVGDPPVPLISQELPVPQQLPPSFTAPRFGPPRNAYRY